MVCNFCFIFETETKNVSWNQKITLLQICKFDIFKLKNLRFTFKGKVHYLS